MAHSFFASDYSPNPALPDEPESNQANELYESPASRAQAHVRETAVPDGIGLSSQSTATPPSQHLPVRSSPNDSKVSTRREDAEGFQYEGGKQEWVSEWVRGYESTRPSTDFPRNASLIPIEDPTVDELEPSEEVYELPTSQEPRQPSSGTEESSGPRTPLNNSFDNVEASRPRFGPSSQLPVRVHDYGSHPLPPTPRKTPPRLENTSFQASAPPPRPLHPPALNPVPRPTRSESLHLRSPHGLKPSTPPFSSLSPPITSFPPAATHTPPLQTVPFPTSIPPPIPPPGPSLDFLNSPPPLYGKSSFPNEERSRKYSLGLSFKLPWGKSKRERTISAPILPPGFEDSLGMATYDLDLNAAPPSDAKATSKPKGNTKLAKTPISNPIPATFSAARPQPNHSPPNPTPHINHIKSPPRPRHRSPSAQAPHVQSPPISTQRMQSKLPAPVAYQRAGGSNPVPTSNKSLRPPTSSPRQSSPQGSSIPNQRSHPVQRNPRTDSPVRQITQAPAKQKMAPSQPPQTLASQPPPQSREQPRPAVVASQQGRRPQTEPSHRTGPLTSTPRASQPQPIPTPSQRPSSSSNRPSPSPADPSRQILPTQKKSPPPPLALSFQPQPRVSGIPTSTPRDPSYQAASKPRMVPSAQSYRKHGMKKVRFVERIPSGPLAPKAPFVRRSSVATQEFLTRSNQGTPATSVESTPLSSPTKLVFQTQIFATAPNRTPPPSQPKSIAIPLSLPPAEISPTLDLAAFYPSDVPPQEDEEEYAHLEARPSIWEVVDPWNRTSEDGDGDGMDPDMIKATLKRVVHDDSDMGRVENESDGSNYSAEGMVSPPPRGKSGSVAFGLAVPLEDEWEHESEVATTAPLSIPLKTRPAVVKEHNGAPDGDSTKKGGTALPQIGATGFGNPFASSSLSPTPPSIPTLKTSKVSLSPKGPPATKHQPPPQKATSAPVSAAPLINQTGFRNPFGGRGGSVTAGTCKVGGGWQSDWGLPEGEE